MLGGKGCVDALLIGAFDRLGMSVPVNADDDDVVCELLLELECITGFTGDAGWLEVGVCGKPSPF